MTTTNVTASVGEPTPIPPRPTMYLTMYQYGLRVWPGGLWEDKANAERKIRTTPGAFVVTIPGSHPAEGTSGAADTRGSSTEDVPARSAGPAAPSPTDMVDVFVTVDGVEGRSQVMRMYSKHICGSAGFAEAHGTCPRCDAEHVARADAEERKANTPSSPPPAREWGEDTMPRINGKPFRCSCQCNVFKKHTTECRYKCNACGAEYTGEPATPPTPQPAPLAEVFQVSKYATRDMARERWYMTDTDVANMKSDISASLTAARAEVERLRKELAAAQKGAQP